MWDGSIRVLTITANPSSQRLLQLMRTVFPGGIFALFPARDFEEGMALLEQDPPDVCLVDPSIKGVTVFELLRLMQVRGDTTPVLVLAEQSQMGVAQAWREAGAADILILESLNPQFLAHVLRSAVTTRRLIDNDRAAAAQARQRKAMVKRMAEATLLITATLTVEDVLSCTSEQARDIIGAHYATACLSSSGATARGVSQSPIYAASWEEIQPEADRIAALVRKANHVVSLNRQEAGGRGWLAAPLAGHDGQPLGIIQLADKFEGEFTENDEAVLVQLAKVAAVAIENARLFTSLRESHQRNTAILESITDAFYTVDREWRFVYLNPEAERLLQRPAGSLIGKVLWDEFPEAANTMARPIFERIVKEGETASFEIYYEPLGMWLDVRAYPNDDGIAVYFRDINERRRNDDALRASEAWYRRLFQDHPQPMWVYDSQTRAFLDVNNAAIAAYGFSRDEFLSMTLEDIRPPEDIPKMIEVTERNRDLPYTVTSPLRHRRKNGEVIYVEIIGHALTYLGRAAKLIVANDITERMTLEEQLRQSQKLEAIGQLAGGIAHDFNNLLTAIIGYSDIALARLGKFSPLAGDLAALRNDIEEVRRAGKHAASLTSQLLAFSRKQILQPRLLNLNDVINSTTRMLRRLIGEDIELRTLLAEDLDAVKVDPVQIEQVILNLAIKARDAMPQGGSLTIETSHVFLDDEYARLHVDVTPGAYVLLAISDTGSGMDAATQARIFEPFFTTKEPGKGTGLGLSTVYGILKQSGGHVAVYSELGKGTTMKVYLPRIGNEGLLAESAAQKAMPAGRENILLVEDDDAVRQYAVQVLRELGYGVLEAAGGEQAIRMARETEIDLLITDVVIPRTNGRLLADQIGALHPRMKILFISGYTEDEIVHRGVLEEGIHFLAKPFTPGEMARRVREVLDGN